MSRKNFKALIISILYLISAVSVAAQLPQIRPTLVVNVMVEGLTDDAVSLIHSQLPEGGLRRVIDRGARIGNLDFGPGLDAVAAAAVLQTGASPAVNGIAAAEIYNPDTKIVRPSLFDTSVIGNFTDETLSATPLKVTTVADELRMDTDGAGLAYSVAADPEIAIIGAGHAGNGAYWISDATGNWASTAYYGDMPSAVSNRNYRDPLSKRLDNMTWTPMLEVAQSPMLSKAEQSKTFKVGFAAKDVDRYRKFKASPLGNTEVTDLAIDLIKQSRLGADSETDMLTVAYNLQYPGASRAQIADAYLRLDRDLKRFFDEAVRSAGDGNIIFVISGLPTKSPVSADHKKWRTPTGQFSVKKAEYLLELYLIANHGNGDWVSGYHDRQIFLNRKLITDRSLNLKDFREEVADFLIRMAGISDVYTIDDVTASRVGDTPQALKRNTSVEHSGDIFLSVSPGWQVVDDPGMLPSDTPGVIRASAARIPAFVAGPKVAAADIRIPADARTLAPAIATLLRLRTPSAASLNTLPLYQ